MLVAFCGFFFVIFKAILVIYFILREGEQKRGRGRERERERERERDFQAGSMHNVEPDAGTDLRTMRS